MGVRETQEAVEADAEEADDAAVEQLLAAGGSMQGDSPGGGKAVS